MSKADKVCMAMEAGGRGFRVFPVSGKIPLVKWKEAATKIPKEIEALWDEHPGANIGIACGEGLVVIDFDDPECDAAKWLEEKLPPTLTCVTGRGDHRYFHCLNSKALRNLQLKGVDLRTDGGLVVGAGSVHKNGTVYGWSKDIPIADLPEEVFNYLKAATKGGSSTVETTGEKGIPQGTRHAWLLKETWKLACTTKLDRDQLLVVVRETLVPRCQNPETITDHEVDEIVNGAIAKRERYAVSLNELTEAGVADKFVEFYDGTIVALNGKDWLRFNDASGMWEKEAGPVNMVLPVREAINRAVQKSASDNEDVLKAVGAFYKSSGTHRYLESVTKLVAPRVTVVESDFQIPEGTLPFRNGMLDMETRKFRPFEKGDFVRETILTDFSPKAKCPKWLKTVDYLTGGDAGLARYIQQVFGFLVSSETMRGIFYLVGVPNSGKNTLVCTLGDIMGRALVSNASKALIHVSKNDDDEQAARRHLALVGRRFVWIDETSQKDVVDSQKFKSIASHRTSLQARRLRQDAFQFENHAKVVVMSNYPPKIDPDDEAAWDRVVYVPFQNKIPDSVRRPDFRDELIAEADGILAWCIAGFGDYLKNGRKFLVPEVVGSQIRMWQEDSTPLLEFVRIACLQGENYECTASQLYQAYEIWRRNQSLGDLGKFNGAPSMSKSLYRLLGEEIGDRRSNKSRFITGIAPVDQIAVVAVT